MAQAQTGDLRISVFNADSLSFLEGAEVRISSDEITRYTGRNGRLTIRNLEVGNYDVVVSFPGFASLSQSAQVEAGEENSLLFEFTEDSEGVIIMEEVTVTFTPSSGDLARAREDAAQNSVDIIASDLFGQLPDSQIADAVRRLPGVNIERNSGEEEGRFVTIRGLFSDFNSVTVDGVPVTVSNFGGASRSVPLDVISAASADSIEVTKAVTPDMDADSIGGAINIRSRSAFDRAENYAFVEVEGIYSQLVNDFDGDSPYNALGFSGQFASSFYLDAEKTWGLAVSGDLRRRDFIEEEIGTTGYSPFGPNGEYTPNGITLQQFFDEITNGGVTTRLDWRPDDETEVAAIFAYTQRDNTNGRQRQLYFNNLETVDGATGDTADILTLNGPFLDRNIRSFADTQQNFVMKLQLERTMDDWTVNGDISYNRGKFAGDPDKDINFTFTHFDTPDLAINSRDDNYEPTLTSDDLEFANDPDAFDYFRGNRSTREVIDDEFVLSADAQREMEWLGEYPGFIKAGFKTRFAWRDTVSTDVVFDEGSFGLDSSVDSFRISGLEVNGTQEAGSLVADWSPSGGIVDDNYDFGPFIDPDQLRSVVSQMQADGLIIERPDNDVVSALNSYEATENIYAGYVMAQASYDKLTLMTGLRFEYTDVNFDANTATLDGIFYDPDTLAALEEGNTYLSVLPGFFARYDANEDTRIRFSVNRTLARPSYNQLNPSEDVEAGEGAGGGDLIERGDTELDPVYSWNIDLSVDWDYTVGGFASIGLFAKFLDNNIYEFEEDIAMDTIVEFRNAEGATVYGIEALIDQRLVFLPGPLRNFGISTNFTLVESSVDTGLPGRDEDPSLFGQVETQVNATLYYEGHGLFARLAYKYTGDYLLFNGLDDDPNLDRFADHFHSLETSVSYEFFDGFTAFGEVQNILNEQDRAYDGVIRRLDFNSYNGRTYFFGLRWQM